MRVLSSPRYGRIETNNRFNCTLSPQSKGDRLHLPQPVTIRLFNILKLEFERTGTHSLQRSTEPQRRRAREASDTTVDY